MFYVRHKESGKIRAVYAVKGTSFLLWDESIGWFYEDLSCYRPYEVTA